MAEIMVAELHQRAQDALDSSPIRALREIRVDHSGRSLVLSGRVNSYYQKQLAQELVRTVASTCDIVNSINVP